MREDQTEVPARERIGCGRIAWGCFNGFSCCGRVIFVSVLPLIFGLLGLAFISEEASALWRGLSSLRWPATTGTILHSSVYYKAGRSRHDSRGYRYYIEYRYPVNGKEYVSERLRFVSSGEYFAEKADADALVAPLPVGRAVRVYYDPNRPSEATLTRWSDLLWGKIAWGLIFLGMSGTIAYFVLFYKPPEKNVEPETASSQERSRPGNRA